MVIDMIVIQVDGVIRASNVPHCQGCFPYFESLGYWHYPWKRFHVAVKPPLPQSPDAMRIIAVPYTVPSGPSAASGSSIPSSTDAKGSGSPSAPGSSKATNAVGVDDREL
jgi:hypothetical protein